MTGLEKIIEQIGQEAKTSSEQELMKAREEAQRILDEGSKEREAYQASFLAQTKSQVELSKARGEAAAVLQRKKILLKEKQQIISQIIEQAKESILNLPDKEYFELLIKMLDRYAKDGKCSILFSERDKNRLSQDFLCELEKRSIVILEDRGKIDGGFILVYGDVEENCSFEALFAASKEVLQDKISALIFTDSGAETER